VNENCRRRPVERHRPAGDAEFWHDSPWPTYDIYQRAAIKRSWNAGKSIFQHEDPAKTEDVRETYRRLAADVVAQLHDDRGAEVDA